MLYQMALWCHTLQEKIGAKVVAVGVVKKASHRLIGNLRDREAILKSGLPLPDSFGLPPKELLEVRVTVLMPDDYNLSFSLTPEVVANANPKELYELIVKNLEEALEKQPTKSSVGH